MTEQELNTTPVADILGGSGVPEFYVETPLSLVERSLYPLKQGDCFAVLDRIGDIGAVPGSPEGIFFRDTRYLSRFEIRFEGQRLLLLGSNLQDDNAALSVDLTNPDINPHHEGGIPRDAIAVSRTKFLWDDVCFERIGLRNFDSKTKSFNLDVLYDADFRDLFEVRGIARQKHGQLSSRVIGSDQVEFNYVGLDGVRRTTTIVFSATPVRISQRSASFSFALSPGGSTSLVVRTICAEERRQSESSFVSALRDKRRCMRKALRIAATLESPDGLFNELLTRSSADLYMLATETEHGRYPYAGMPWYSTPFGRDGIITAMQMLWLDPSIAAGVLRYLAATQAHAYEPTADAEPGKILHERRRGEMARTGEVPFLCYYGTVDATPLFVMLAGMYYERTGDMALLREVWPAVTRALQWCDECGDRDGDGFVEYFRATEHGLANQGWKDSHDSISHADGRLATGPIALCEVQGYLYAARQYAAEMALALGEGQLSAELQSRAAILKEQFDKAFWCDEIGTYALALDGDKMPCRVRSSNAGHALFTGIATPEHAARTVATLMAPDSFSGWGVRTLARTEARYNPMSYHNGSIWPHDNALLAIGFSRYGFRREACRVAEAVFDAAAYQDQRRLPELYCGFLRKPRRGPVRYPVACSPQAWAAAAPFAFLSACLGLDLSALRNTIQMNDPMLPARARDLRVRNLQLGATNVNFSVHSEDGDVGVRVQHRSGDARIIICK